MPPKGLLEVLPDVKVLFVCETLIGPFLMSQKTDHGNYVYYYENFYYYFSPYCDLLRKYGLMDKDDILRLK